MRDRQMWHRSESFILDKQHQNGAVSLTSSAPMAGPGAPTDNPPNPKISMYYHTRAAHHGVVTSDWLAQAQAAVGGCPEDPVSDNYVSSGEDDNGFSVIDEFNNWRKQPDLAEAVAAIRALLPSFVRAKPSR